jgi:hypothetical protein
VVVEVVVEASNASGGCRSLLWPSAAETALQSSCPAVAGLLHGRGRSACHGLPHGLPFGLLPKVREMWKSIRRSLSHLLPEVREKVVQFVAAGSVVLNADCFTISRTFGRCESLFDVPSPGRWPS